MIGLRSYYRTHKGTPDWPEVIYTVYKMLGAIGRDRLLYTDRHRGGPMSRIFLPLTLFLFPLVQAETNPYMLLQKPALSHTQIVFSYAGDLWSVPREGGDAVRLTSGAGTETDPAFSPDGNHIDFTGEYDGNVVVFVVPAGGCVPNRLTWHPAPDRVLVLTTDGKHIIFSSTRTAYTRI